MDPTETSTPESAAANEAPAAPPAPATWQAALMASPGPRSWSEAGILSLKGLCMGAADIVPGVSGGTIAFITGIYENFLAAIASVDGAAIRDFTARRWKSCLARIHARFLVALLLGIGISIIGLTKVVHKALEIYPVHTWSFFFGLIIASIIILSREVKGWNLQRVLLLIGGAGFAWWFTGLIPVDTPDSLWFIFLCGMISICAMVLPGISGSFLLVVLGKYVYITGQIHNIFTGNLRDLFSAKALSVINFSAILILLVFMGGCIVGLGGFSRFLKWLLSKWHEATMCVLTGFMIGALRKVWPWKQQLELELYNRTSKVDGVLQTVTKEKVVEEAMVWPWQYVDPYTQETFLREGLDRQAQATTEIVRASSHLPVAIGLAVLGVILVLVLEYVATKKKQTDILPPADKE